MLKRFSGRSSFTLAFVLVGGGIIGIGLLVLRDLQSGNQQARQMYAGLVRELDLIGGMQYQAQEARRSMLYALTTTDSNLQVRYADQSRAADARVAEMIAEHVKIARLPHDTQSGKQLERDWKAYLQIRDEVIASILEGSIKDSVERDLRDGVPAFNRVRDDLREINQLYKEQAEHQLAEVETASKRSLQKVVVILCLTQLFLVGFAIRTVQRGKMLRVVLHSESRLREVIESINEGMFVVGRDGRLALWNGAAERILDRTREQVLGRPLLEALPHFVDTSLPSAVVAAMQTGRPALLTDLHFTGKLSKRVFEVRLFPFEEGITVFVSDMTEGKNLEEQLRQAQKMEAVGRLSGGIAHDFNNLLGVIIGYSELLEERLAQNDPLRLSAEQIKKAGQRAASLTRQLLAFSRQQVLEPKVLDLNTVVADAEKMLRRLIGEDIELTAVLDPGLGRVKADPGQIEQIILNLAVNARDAMPQGGKLTIETASVELDEDYARLHPPMVPGSFVQLSVTDTGVGMDRGTQARIFEPFFTTKEIGKGTGLGLATVYGVIKQSSGYIWVDSEPGRGTTFKIHLPRVEQAAPTAQPNNTASKALQQTSETVLLVEDEESLRTLTHSLLARTGYTVLEASSGAQAIDLARRHQGPIHLLLTDVVMPGMSGRALAQNLIPSHPEMKVLYMSGYTDYAIASRGVLESGTVLLQKPFTREALGQKVREVLQEGDKPRLAVGLVPSDEQIVK